MALQLRGSRVKVSKLTGALVAVFALFIQPLVALNVPSAFAAPVINEVMPNPVELGEATTEWIEIKNIGNNDTDISNWTVAGGTIPASTPVLAAGEIFLLCKTLEASTECDASDSSLALTNTGTQLLQLNDDGGVTVDEFTYTGSDNGESIEVVREDNTATGVNNDTDPYDTSQDPPQSGNTGTPGAENRAQSNSPVTNVNTGEGFSTIKKAIDDAETLDGHTIYIQNGTYDEDVVLTKSLTLEGESEAGVIIIADDGSYGLEDRGTGLTITLKNFTLQDAVTYGIKLDGNDATLRNVTVENSGSSEFDFNGMNSIVLRNVTANGNGTAGNGISFTNSNNIDLDGATTTGNNWGGVALYPYGTDYPVGINSAKIYNLNASEANELYQQVGSGKTPAGTLDAPQYTFGVTNDEFRPGAEQFTFYQRTLANANNFGRSLQVGNTDSAIFRLDTGVRIVPTNGFTIKAALEDAPANGTVRLQPGTHANDIKQIVAADNVTLVGSGVDTTTIAAQFSTGASASDDTRGWFLVENGVEFNVRNVTFDATGQNVWQAIRHRGSGSINNVAFRNIGYNPSSSYQGTAVAAFGTGATNVTNSTFENIGRIGVLYFGAGVSGSRFVGNTYTGKGDGNWLDYAADISAGAEVRVVNNTITNNRGEASDSSSSAGLLVTTFFASGTSVRMNNNTLQGNSTGVAVGFNDSDTSSVIARNNTIDGNDRGAYSTNQLVDFRQNYWGSNSGPTDNDATDGSVPLTNPGGTGDTAEDNVWYSNWIVNDTTKPVTEVVSPQPDGQAYNSNFTIQANTKDDESGIEKAVINLYDTAGFKSSCTNETVTPPAADYDYECDIDVASLANGDYYIKVNSRDAAGNVSNTVVWNFTVDKTKPSVKVVDPETGDVKQSSFTVTGTASDGQTSVDRVEYSVTEITAIGGSYVANVDSGTANGTNNWDFDVSGLDDGYYRLKVQSFDAAGNWKYDYNDVEVDTTAPSFIVTSPSNGSSSTDTTPTFSGTGESGATITVEVDGQTLTTEVDSNGDWSVTAAELANGTYTATITSTDTAGNTSGDQEVTFTITPKKTPTPGSDGVDNLPTPTTVNPSPVSQSGNSTPGTISPLSQLAFNQGIAGTSNTGAASGIFGSTPSTTGSSESDDDTSGDVLGTESPSTDSSVKSAAVAQSPEGWKLFGIAWYWVLLLLAALAGLWWFLVSRRNAAEDENL